MLKRLNKSMDEKDAGFTLIELLVVVVIIGVLAAIAIPVFLNQRQKAADAGTKSDLKNAATMMETFFVDNQTYKNSTTTNPTTSPITGLKKSGTAVVAVTSSNASGYCLTGTNTGGSQTWIYDSGAGGLQASSVTACPNSYA